MVELMKLLESVKETVEKNNNTIKDIETKIEELGENIKNNSTEDLLLKTQENIKYKKEIAELKEVKEEIKKDEELLIGELTPKLLEELKEVVVDLHPIKVKHKTELIKVCREFLENVKKVDDKFKKEFNESYEENEKVLKLYEEVIEVPDNISNSIYATTFNELSDDYRVLGDIIRYSR